MISTTTHIHFDILSRLLLLVILVVLGYLGLTYAPTLAEPLRERMNHALEVSEPRR